MTQADLQRDAERLESLRSWLDSQFCPPAYLPILDRSIETARVLASMSDEQRTYLVEHCTEIAKCDERAASEDDTGGVTILRPSVTADAHRKVARLMGGT